MPNFRRIVCSLSVLLLLALPLAAQQSLTLDDCLREAFQSSNLLRIADLGVEAALERNLQSRSQRVPSLSTRASYLRIGKVSSFSIPMGPGGALREFKFGTPNRINADLNVGLPLFTWGRINAQVEAAALGVTASRTDRRQKALEVTDQVLRAYYNCLLARDAITASAAQLDRAEKNLAVAEKRFADGHAAKLEYLRAEVQAVNARSQYDEALSALEKSNVWLAKTIGREGEKVTAAGSLTFAAAAVDVDSLIQRAEAQRLDLQMLQLQKDILAKQSATIGSALRPNLTGVAAYSVQNGFSPMNPDEFVDNWNVGVQLSFPFFDGGLTKHRVQETQKQIISLQYQEKEVRELLSAQIRQAVLSLQQAEKKYRVQHANIDVAREALTAAEQQYRQGFISSLDLLAAQQALAESELMELRALNAHILAKLDLCRAVGDYRLFDLIPSFE